MRILIVDCDSLVTAAIQTLLEKRFGFEVFGLTTLKAKSLPGNRKPVDAVVIYLGFQGVESIRQISGILKQVDAPAVVISPNASKEHIAQVLQTGVQALVPQSAPA